MKRISTGIFISPGHKVAWSSSTKYLSCECKQFKFNNECDFANKAREILKGEGKEVKYKKKPKPLFLMEIETFTKVLSEVKSGTYKIDI
jgi:hypothetical protein